MSYREIYEKQNLNFISLYTCLITLKLGGIVYQKGYTFRIYIKTKLSNLIF